MILLTAQEVADYLGISRSTVYKKAKLGLIRHIKYETTIRFYEGDVIDYKKAHTLYENVKKYNQM